MLEDLIQLLGLREDSDAVKAVAAKYSMVRSEADDDGDFFLESPRAGISIAFISGPFVQAVALHSGGRHGYAAFQNALPGDLTFQSKKEDVRRIFGSPDKHRGPFVSSFDPAPCGGWDLFQRDGYSIHFEYDALSQVRAVTFQKG